MEGTSSESVVERQAEVDLNFSKFKELLGSLSASSGKFALMRRGEVIQVYDTFSDALNTATTFYVDGLYSIQKITSQPIDLGYRSRALLRR